MNVLFLIDTLQTGGAERSILEIASRFTRYNPVVVQIYPGDKLKAEFESRGIKVISLNVAGKKKYAEAIKKILPVVEEYKPVLIHATLYRSEIISRRLKTLLKLPLVNSFVNNRYTTERYAQLGFTGKAGLLFYQICDRFSAGKPDLFFSNSHSIARNNAIALKVPKHKVKVIPRGREMKRFSERPFGVEDLRKQYGLEGKRLVLTVGRMLKSKGHPDLLEAFIRIHENFPDVVLAFAGDGPNRSMMQQRAKAAGVSEKVLMPGDQNNIPVWLHLADVFAFPSHYEGLPGALIEAMMAGRIIIASDIPENLECVDEHSAIIYPKGDVDVLSEKLAAVLSDTGQWKMIAEKAQQTAAEKFDINAVAAAYENEYDKLIQLS